jgi:hypothetical protein
MHEMGIILNLAKTLDQVAEENHLSKIGAVTIEIGEVSGIVTDLLRMRGITFRKSIRFSRTPSSGSRRFLRSLTARGAGRITRLSRTGGSVHTAEAGRPG